MDQPTSAIVEEPVPEPEEIHPDVERITDPLLRDFAKNLPIMRDGKPRRFEHPRNCYEWTFTQVKRWNDRTAKYDTPAAFTAGVEETAKALWGYFGTEEAWV